MNKKNSILLLSLLLVSCNQAQVDNPSNNDLSESVTSESSLIMPSIEISNSENSIEPTIEPTPVPSEPKPTVEPTTNPIPVKTFSVDLSNQESIVLLRYNDRYGLTSYKEEIMALFDDLTFTNEVDLSDKFVYEDVFTLRFGQKIKYLVNKNNQVLYEKDGVNYFSSIDPNAYYDINSFFKIDLDLSKAKTDEIKILDDFDDVSLVLVSRGYEDNLMIPCHNKQMIDEIISIFSKLELSRLDLTKLSEEENDRIKDFYIMPMMKCYNLKFKDFTINIALDFSVYVEIDETSYYGQLTEEEYAFISYIYYL